MKSLSALLEDFLGIQASAGTIDSLHALLGVGLAGAGVPSHLDGGGVDHMGAEVAHILDVAGGPAGSERAAVALSVEVEEGDLAVGRVVATGGNLFVDDVQDGVVLVLAIGSALNLLGLAAGGAAGGVALEDGVCLITVPRDAAVKDVSCGGGHLLGVAVAGGLPLEVLGVEVPGAAEPRIDRLEQIEVVGGIHANPRGVEGEALLRGRSDLPLSFPLGDASASRAGGSGVAEPARRGILGRDAGGQNRKSYENNLGHRQTILTET